MVLLPSDPIFNPLVGDLVRVPGEPLRVCNRCSVVLKNGLRPKWAIRFPLADKRFSEFTELEMRLIMPIIVFQTIYQLPGGEGQYASTGGTVSFANDSLKVAQRLPRPVNQNGAVWVRGKKTTAGQIVSEVMVRPDQMRKFLADVIGTKHPAFLGIDLDEDVLAALATE